MNGYIMSCVNAFNFLKKFQVPVIQWGNKICIVYVIFIFLNAFCIIFPHKLVQGHPFTEKNGIPPPTRMNSKPFFESLN